VRPTDRSRWAYRPPCSDALACCESEEARALLTAAPAGAAVGAKPIEQFHDHFTESFSDVICGIPVDVVIVVTDNFFLYEDDSFRDTASFRSTVTNPVNGDSVRISSAGQNRGSAPIVDEEAGTITFLTSFKGRPEKVQTANGPFRARRQPGALTEYRRFSPADELVPVGSRDMVASSVPLHGRQLGSAERCRRRRRCALIRR